jgi:hypothetical protein
MGEQDGHGDGGYNSAQVEEEPPTPLPPIDRRLHLFDSRLLVPEF